MNLYKNLLFLQGHFTDPRMDDGYGPTYGTPVANARARAERWQDGAEAARAAVLAASPAIPATVTCGAGACAGG